VYCILSVATLGSLACRHFSNAQGWHLVHLSNVHSPNTHTHTQPFNGPWSGTTRVGRYQKKHSPTHTHPDHQTSFINFLHLLRSIASSVFSLRAWQSSLTTPLLRTPCISLPSHHLLFAAHTHTNAAAVIPMLCHLYLVSLSQLLTWESATHPPDHSHLCSLKCHHIFFPYRPVLTSVQQPNHTRPFNGPFSGTTRVSRSQKGKTNLDFTEARDSAWQWHQLGHMQVCISLLTDNHASTPPLKFFTGLCPSCCPTNNVKALKVLNWYHVLIYSKQTVCGFKLPSFIVRNSNHILVESV